MTSRCYEGHTACILGDGVSRGGSVFSFYLEDGFCIGRFKGKYRFRGIRQIRLEKLYVVVFGGFAVLGDLYQRDMPTHF